MRHQIRPPGGDRHRAAVVRELPTCCRLPRQRIDARRFSSAAAEQKRHPIVVVAGRRRDVGNCCRVWHYASRVISGPHRRIERSIGRGAGIPGEEQRRRPHPRRRAAARPVLGLRYPQGHGRRRRRRPNDDDDDVIVLSSSHVAMPSRPLVSRVAFRGVIHKNKSDY